MTGKSRRGFASMDPSRQREIASKGGRAAHAKGTAHEWSSDEARTAGRKGGEVVSRDRAHMAAIGREGGEARGRKNAALRQQRQQTSGDQFSDRESPVLVSREGVNRGADRSETSRESSRGRLNTNEQSADRGDEASDQG
jgi:general stress protein YciG